MLVDYASGTAWAFPPGAALDAGRYLLVFASGKDLFGSELHTNFRISASSAQTLGLLNTDGSEIERLTVPPLAADESYSRIPDAAGLFQITLRPTPEAQNSAAPVEPTPGAENLVINELVANNANNVGLSLVQYPGGDKLDWIEIYNKGNTAVKMGGLKLSDAKNTWIFPDSVPDLEAHQFLLVFSSGGGPNVRELHTNFRISSDTGEVISLLNKNNQVIDSLKVWLLAADECYARYPDGTGTAVVMTTPTPGMANLDRRVTNPAGASDILINEVVSANQNNLGLDLNKYPGASSCDWIELYNKGSQSVNLGGLKLFASNQGWRFPDVTLGAREYRLVFASGRNWLDNELHTNFAIGATKKEQLLLLNKDNSQIQEVIVPPLEADQSFSRIRPGTATSDFAIVRDPTPEALNSNVLVDRRYPPPGKCPIVINEVLSNNAHNQNLNLGQYPGGNRQDWIELYNSGSQPVDLIGLKLMSESADTQGRFFGNGTAWVFPSVVLQPGDYRLVFASGMDLRGSELHTNFAISSTWGERLQLLDRENSVIQTVDIPQLAADVSFAARPNGDKNSFSVCTSPTPGAFNPGGIILPPVVSITSPANNAFIAAGINKTISVSTSASSGRSISRIEFFNGAEKIGESAASPFSLVWNNVPEGAYALTAKATDSAGAYTVSQAITGEAVLYGDVNVDGSVTAIDASMAARNAVGTLNLSSAQVRKADVNNIAGVTASDASWIARKAVGSVALFPIEQG
jgi:hypothetical protein